MLPQRTVATLATVVYLLLTVIAILVLHAMSRRARSDSPLDRDAKRALRSDVGTPPWDTTVAAGRPVVIWDTSVPGRYYDADRQPLVGKAGERPARWRSVDGSDWLQATEDGPTLESVFDDGTTPAPQMTAPRGASGGMHTAYSGYAANQAAYAVVFGPSAHPTADSAPFHSKPLLSRWRPPPPVGTGGVGEEAWAGPFAGVFYGWGTGDNAPLGPVPVEWSAEGAAAPRRRVAIISVDGAAVRVRWSNDAVASVREIAIAPDRFDASLFALNVLLDPALVLYELQIHRRPLGRSDTDDLFDRLTEKWRTGVAVTTTTPLP